MNMAFVPSGLFHIPAGFNVAILTERQRRNKNRNVDSNTCSFVEIVHLETGPVYLDSDTRLVNDSIGEPALITKPCVVMIDPTFRTLR